MDPCSTLSHLSLTGRFVPWRKSALLFKLSLSLSILNWILKQCTLWLLAYPLHHPLPTPIFNISTFCSFEVFSTNLRSFWGNGNIRIFLNENIWVISRSEGWFYRWIPVPSFDRSFVSFRCFSRVTNAFMIDFV